MMTDLIRLTHNRTGVVINVDPATRADLDREWVEDGADESVEFEGTDELDGTEGPEGTDGADESEESEGEESPEPPAGNASRDEWAAFATGLGITVEDSAKRDEIRAQVEHLLDAGDEPGE